jgi:hypothetical protein
MGNIVPDDKDYLMDALDIDNVYVWIMWNEQSQEWEKVCVVIVSHPLLNAVIKGGLDVDNGRFALTIVGSGLALKYGIPTVYDEDGNMREFWKRSRIITLTDHPEKVKWKVSGFLEEFGYKVPEGHIPVFII